MLMPHIPPSPPGLLKQSWPQMQMTPQLFRRLPSASKPQPTTVRVHCPNSSKNLSSKPGHSSSPYCTRKRRFDSSKSDWGWSTSPRVSSTMMATLIYPAPPAQGSSSPPCGSEGWGAERWRCEQRERERSLPTWPNSSLSQITHKNQQTRYQDGSLTSCMEPTAASTLWPKQHGLCPTGQCTLKWYDTATKRQTSATSNTSSRSCQSGWRPAGPASPPAATAWRPGTSLASSATSRAAAHSVTTIPSPLNMPTAPMGYPTGSQAVKRISQLQEHLPDGGVMSPPGYADELPTSWFVNSTTVSFTSRPHSQSPRIGPEGDRHVFVLPWYRSWP